MNRNELNELIAKTQPNICQIVVLMDGNEVFSGEWNGCYPRHLDRAGGEVDRVRSTGVERGVKTVRGVPGMVSSEVEA